MKKHTCQTIPPKNRRTSHFAAIADTPDINARDKVPTFSTDNDDKFWKTGNKLTIRFMEPVSPDFLGAFARVISQWARYGNLEFKIVTSGNAHIRITTDTDEAKSTVGTDALTIEPDQPTMHLPVIPEDEDFEQVVLHEMGHALGFQHEHLHRDANIPWNREKVYQHYFDTLEWDRQFVDKHVLTPHTSVVANTGYDPLSVMHYPIDKSLTDGVFEVGDNTQLSEIDKTRVAHVYARKSG